jgi:hypothetical protein
VLQILGARALTVTFPLRNKRFAPPDARGGHDLADN